MACVVTNTSEFKALLSAYNVSKNDMEIAIKTFLDKNNLEEYNPQDKNFSDYLDSYFQIKSSNEYSSKEDLNNALKVWEKYDQLFKETENLNEYLNDPSFLNTLESFFEKENYVIYNDLKGNLKIKIGKPFQKTSPNSIKEGVPELFESNPDLADAVYEALGFGQLKEPKVNDIVTLEFYFEKEDKTVPVKVKITELEKFYQGASTIKDNQGNIIKQEKGTPEYFLTLEKLDGGKKYEVSVGEDGYINQFVGGTGKTRVGTNNYIPEFDLSKSQITPEQKQQAQQLYSKYLDTIGVTDIGYHHSESDLESFTTFSEGYFPKELKKKGTHYKEADDIVFFVKKPLSEEFMSKRKFTGTWGLKIPNTLQFNAGEKIGEGVHPGIDEGVKNAVDGKYDAVDFGRIRDNKTWSEVVAITNPKNAVKLGSKQDIEGFKEFVGQENNDISTFTNYSGGAQGGDAMWENIGKEFGLGKQVNYRPEDLKKLTKEQLQEVENAYQQAVKDLGRRSLDANTFAGGLVRRDYLQAKAADEVFAIGEMVSPGQKDKKGYVNKTQQVVVSGGTGYAVQMALNLGKKVHVFDQNEGKWYYANEQPTGIQWVEENTPKLSKKFAGIGTREINEAGKQAIRDVYEATVVDRSNTLESKLKTFFNGFGFQFKEGDSSTDLLNKIIYTSSKDSSVFINNSVKALSQLLLANTNIDFHKLENLIEDTPEFKKLLNNSSDYLKTTHKFLKEGNRIPMEEWVSYIKDYNKIKNEVLEKYLKESLLDDNNSTGLHKIINDFLKWFKGLFANAKNLKEVTDSLIQQALLNQRDVIINSKDLQNKERVTLAKALEETTHGKNIIKTFGEFGLILTGSVSAAEQGSVFRKTGKLLHDIDWVVPKGFAKDFNKKLKDTFPGATLVREFDSIGYYTQTYIVPPKGHTISNLTFFKPETYGERKYIASYDVLDKNGNVVSNYRRYYDVKESGKVVENREIYNEGLENVDKNIEAVSVDFFQNKEDLKYEPYTVNVKGINLQLSNWLSSFTEKLKYGRAKDLLDYANFIPNDLVPQTSQTTSQQKQKESNYYEGNIKPEPNTVFVFGSNPEGRHGAGAAKVAREQFGAIYGQGEGLQGNAYALPTKDLRVKENRGFKSISPEQIIESIKTLYQVAKQNSNKQFKVAYRNTTDTSLNGYTGLEMIEMFNQAGAIPSNVIFSKEWVDTGKLNTQSETTSQQKTTLAPKGTINVYWGQGESESSTRILSNLAPRKFNYKSTDGITREYGSVEHAYQSNKSGRFDQDTYNAYNRIQSMEFEGQGTSISIEIKGESGKEFLLTRNRNSAQYVLWSEKKEDGSYTTSLDTPTKAQVENLAVKYIPVETRKAIDKWVELHQDVNWMTNPELTNLEKMLKEELFPAKDGYGRKIAPKVSVAEMKAADSLGLMKKLVVESFKQNSNSEAAKKLLQYENFTHNTNQLIDKAFLEGLKLAQKELRGDKPAQTVKP